jgi:hypothetical protein
MVVRGVVKGLLSKGFCQSDRCQRAAVKSSIRVAAVRVAAVRELLSEGFCHSGRWQRAAVRGLLSEWLLSESKSVTKLLHSSVLLIHTVRNLPKKQTHEIIQTQPKTQQSEPGNPNPDPMRANLETQEPTQKEKQSRPKSGK